MNTSITRGARILLDLIYKTETGRDAPACYRTIIGHREGSLQRSITSLTIAELLEAQKTWGKKWKSSAAGAPQIIRATLATLARRLGLTGAELFDEAMQDRLAFELLRIRGWEAFAAGRITMTEFGNALAREWASFPVLTAQQGAHGRLKRGRSYYDGDGLNSALIKPELVEATLREALAAERKPAGAPAPPKAPEPAPSPQPAPPPAPLPKEAPPEKLSTSKRMWTWLTTGVTGGGLLSGLGGLDPWLQRAAGIVLIGLALYAIASMPQVRRKLGLG